MKRQGKVTAREYDFEGVVNGVKYQPKSSDFQNLLERTVGAFCSNDKNDS